MMTRDRCPDFARTKLMIPIRCPHCGTTFVMDPKVETVSTRTSSYSEIGSPALAYLPVCPICDRRVVVRIPTESQRS